MTPLVGMDDTEYKNYALDVEGRCGYTPVRGFTGSESARQAENPGLQLDILLNTLGLTMFTIPQTASESLIKTIGTPTGDGNKINSSLAFCQLEVRRIALKDEIPEFDPSMAEVLLTFYAPTGDKKDKLVDHLVQEVLVINDYTAGDVDTPFFGFTGNPERVVEFDKDLPKSLTGIIEEKDPPLFSSVRFSSKYMLGDRTSSTKDLDNLGLFAISRDPISKKAH